MKKIVVIYLILAGIGFSSVTMYSCRKSGPHNSAVDKRKRKMGKRKMKKTELGCPMKDC